MSNDKDPSTSSDAKEISSNGNNISEVKSEKHGPNEIESYHFSKDNIPS
jgi:hypothetical protein